MRHLLLAAPLAALLAVRAAASPCALRKVQPPVSGRRAAVTEAPMSVTASSFTVENKDAGTKCSLSQDLWTAIYLTTDEGTLLFKGDSGSMSGLSFYGTADCKPRHGSFDDWKASDWIVEGARLVDTGTCDCYEAGIQRENCGCRAARVFELRGKDCAPVMLEKESAAETKRRFGVAFKGRARLAFPGTKKAGLIEDKP